MERKVQLSNWKISSELFAHKTRRTLPHGDAEGMRRWRYKEKRPTKVTIYNRYSARYRMSRAGVMHEEEEEEEDQEKKEQQRCAEEQAVRHEDGDILIMGATKRGGREE